eukprot:s1572_g15.t1
MLEPFYDCVSHETRPGPFATCFPGTGSGLALESSGEKDHDGPFGGCAHIHGFPGTFQIPTRSRFRFSCDGDLSASMQGAESIEWPQLFATSRRMNPMTLVIFRGLSASLFVVHQLAHFWACRDEGFFYFIYLTHWTMILGTISECVLFHLASTGNQRNQQMLPFPAARRVETPTLVRIELVLWHIVHPFSLIVKSLYWASWLLENPLEDLQKIGYLDFYTHGFAQFWLLLSFLVSNVPFSMCTGFGWTVTYALIYIAWSLVHFLAKIGTPQPCDGYPQNECPIYNKFDWHKPQLTTVIALLVCLVACPVVCTFYATLASRNPRWRKLQLMQRPFEFASPKPCPQAFSALPGQQKQPVGQKQVGQGIDEPDRISWPDCREI